MLKISCGMVCAGMLGVVSVLLCGASADAQRLPQTVLPEHYALRLTPDLKAATFRGDETIDVMTSQAMNSITLNALEIKFDAVTTMVADKTLTATVTEDPAKEQVTFHFGQTLPAGKLALKIRYTGILNDKLRGFYLSKTAKRNYAVTQFESTDARRAFPSFDEPAFKATYAVTLVVDKGDTAISNTNIVKDEPAAGDKHAITFAVTPKMSTYLVAWLVGDFKCSSGKADGVAIRACSTPDKVKLTRFALDSAKETLRDYDKYFGIKYPLAKLDLVAIPDFEAGAMENYGCITFRETDLLVDKRDGGLSAKKSVAETVAHEMAHLWFGDLVTPAWWDDLWLNEGFATWMENKEAARLHPKWGFDQDAAVDLDRTMNDDAGRTTRSIRAHVETPAEIEESFDDIAYGKAGAVIAMVENWVGEEKFRKGVQEYLAEHAYANATAEDFWNVQTRVSGMPVDQVMRSFVTQPGVPVVTLGSGGANAPVAQRRFYLSDAAAKKSEAANKKTEVWTIPVCFAREACRLLTPETTTLDVPVTAANHGMGYANAGDKGYYRTDYSAVQLATIVGNAETGLTVAERIGLLGDRWALMREGEGSVGEILDLTLAVKGDAYAAVVESALG